MCTNIHMVAAGFSLRRKIRIKAKLETQPKGCGYLKNGCPEGASSELRFGLGSNLSLNLNLSLGC